MHALVKPIYPEGKQIFCLISSLEYPLIYLRMSGQIETTFINKDVIYYHITPISILEVDSVIMNWFHNHSFRIKTPKQNFINKHYYIADKKKSPNKVLIEKYSQFKFDVSSLMSFETLEDLNQGMNEVNIDILNFFNTQFQMIQQRTKI